MKPFTALLTTIIALTILPPVGCKGESLGGSDRPVAVISILPSGAVLQIGESLQLQARAWDDSGDQLTGITVSWSSSDTTVVTVDATGLITAHALGRATVTAAVDGVTGSANLSVTVTGTAEPILEEDFSTYTSTADMLSDPRNIYATEDDANTQLIELDQTVGFGSSGQTMRYTFPDRTSSSGRCTDFSIGRNLGLPNSLKEVWVEAYVRFSANFKTRAPNSWGCTSNSEYKFIFGQTYGGSGRFNLNVGTYGDQWTFGYPGDLEGVGGTPRGTIPGADAVWDGQWHQYRLYLRVSSATDIPDGGATFWLDGRQVKTFVDVVVNRSVIWSIALGRNMNQGPDQEISLWWGPIRVYDQNPGW